MAHRILLLFLLYRVLNGQESKLPSVKECCEVGQLMGLRGQNCAALPPFTSRICSITQEQCCRSVARDRACNNGLEMARGQGACERPFFTGLDSETQTSRICCDCCTLGLMAARMGLSCEISDLQLGRQCTDAAKTCCEEPEGSAEATAENEGVPTQPPEQADACRDSNCSQVCADDGKCACREGFQLNMDGVTCQDIDECRQYPRWLCAHQCENTEGSYHCTCRTGFKLAHDGSNCEDIDECALWTHDCGTNFVCVNTPGSFFCHLKKGCGDGYVQDAASSCIGQFHTLVKNIQQIKDELSSWRFFSLSIDINECVATISPCRPGQTCINTVGSYRCRSNIVTCARGYHLTVDGKQCEDVDECLTGNVCGGIHGCINLEGSYHCECRKGFAFNSITKLCQDINECTSHPGRLCAHKCENTEGSFLCSCATGFQLAHDGRNCEDINECESKPCSQECANIYGSYQCYCRHGYQLSDMDGITCDDIDECMLPNVCSYRCINTPGGFNCTCPPSGYTLTDDGRTCQDIDECAAGTHTCSASEQCFNIQGGFRCLLFKCPPNFSQAAQGPKTETSIVVRCIKTCPRHDTGCIRNPVHIVTSTVLSLPTMKHFKEPEEIAVLRTKQAPLPNQPDVYFDIVATDEHYSFDVVKRSHHGKIVGVIRQVKPIIGPRELVLEVTMNYVLAGVVSQQNIVIIHVFISEFWF
ncbi:fibulin-1-like isoform X1 [Cololabis saira]|uniref:fibulin-1-like isoform X1 n=1 Tax=Cololabis saira TaxID=129043 RepID=UPI002AD4D5C3|nr:fibulin-1-like isoform X1 [Cololabis saira]